MPQPLHCKYGHIVFSTKSRQPIITADLEPRLFEYLGGIVRGMKGHLIEINGSPLCFGETSRGLKGRQRSVP